MKHTAVITEKEVDSQTTAWIIHCKACHKTNRSIYRKDEAQECLEQDGCQPVNKKCVQCMSRAELIQEHEDIDKMTYDEMVNLYVHAPRGYYLFADSDLFDYFEQSKKRKQLLTNKKIAK